MGLLLHTVGGLSNRVQSILGYRSLWVPPLRVLWEPSQAVSGGLWEDVFESLEGVEIRTPERKPGGAYGYGHKIVTVDHAPGRQWREHVGELNPSRDVAGRVATVLGALPEDFAAIHVRRTDFVECAKAHGLTLPSLDEYVRFAHGPGRGSVVYVATDNACTQSALFLAIPTARLGAAVDGGEAHQAFGDDRRHTSLVDAAVDLFVCARAARFMGTPGSTFTTLIEELRALRAFPCGEAGRRPAGPRVGAARDDAGTDEACSGEGEARSGQ